MTRLWHPL